MWITHTNKCYLALQGRKLLAYATAWMCLEDIVLSKTNQSQNLMIENKTKSHSQMSVTPAPGAPALYWLHAQIALIPRQEKHSYT